MTVTHSAAYTKCCSRLIALWVFSYFFKPRLRFNFCLQSSMHARRSPILYKIEDCDRWLLVVIEDISDSFNRSAGRRDGSLS